MKRVIVLYATREGQTRRIAEHVAATMRARDIPVDVVDVKHPPEGFTLDGYSAAVVAASIHLGRHEREMITFVKRHRADLEALATAFLSVSMAEAGAENVWSTPEARATGAEEVQVAIQKFFAETGWHPARVRPIAGALLYRQYGFLTRLVMRGIAKRKGGDTDTSRDFEYTDWEALDRFVGELAEEVQSRAEDGGGVTSLSRARTTC
jgi:menaquinone-dependent protoporphyrinogen oxidase